MPMCHRELAGVDVWLTKRPPVGWIGTFYVYSPGGTWNDVPGVYVFSYVGQDNRWQPLYVGQADSFSVRFANHERWDEAVRRGVTHIHAMTVTEAAARSLTERRLIATYQPPMNIQGR